MCRYRLRYRAVCYEYQQDRNPSGRWIYLDRILTLKLSSLLSDQILQLADVYSKGEDIFGSRNKVNLWMETPNKALGQKKPVELLSSSYGVQMIHEVLGRIEHGIYS